MPVHRQNRLKFVERAIANGMNVFRIFEATNDFRNIESATKAVKSSAARPCRVNYTVSPVHTLEKWMEYAEQLIGRRGLVIVQRCHGNLDAFDSYKL
jgi:pyruvate/oxaloacetate carboxyltransferase